MERAIKSVPSLTNDDNNNTDGASSLLKRRWMDPFQNKNISNSNICMERRKTEKSHLPMQKINADAGLDLEDYGNICSSGKYGTDITVPKRFKWTPQANSLNEASPWTNNDNNGRKDSCIDEENMDDESCEKFLMPGINQWDFKFEQLILELECRINNIYVK